MTASPDAAETLYTYTIVPAGTLAPAVPGLLPGTSVQVIGEGPVRAVDRHVAAAGGRTLQSLARLEKAQETVRLVRRAATIARLAALLDGHARARGQSFPLGPLPAAEVARLRAALDAQAAELAASGTGHPIGIPGIGAAWPATVFAKPAVNDVP